MSCCYYTKPCSHPLIAWSISRVEDKYLVRFGTVRCMTHILSQRRWWHMDSPASLLQYQIVWQNISSLALFQVSNMYQVSPICTNMHQVLNMHQWKGSSKLFPPKVAFQQQQQYGTLFSYTLILTHEQNCPAWLKGDAGQQTEHFAVGRKASKQSFTGAVGINWAALVPSKRSAIWVQGKHSKFEGKLVSKCKSTIFGVGQILSLKLINADGAYFFSQECYKPLSMVILRDSITVV